MIQGMLLRAVRHEMGDPRQFSLCWPLGVERLRAVKISWAVKGSEVGRHNTAVKEITAASRQDQLVI